MKNIWNFHAKMHLRIKGAFFVFPVSLFFMRFTAVSQKKMHKTPCNIVRQASYSGLLRLIPDYSSQIGPIPAESALLRPIPDYSSQIGPIPAYSALLRPVPAYSVLFQLIDSRRHMVKLAKGFILLLSSACLCSCSSGVCLGSPLICGVCLGTQPIHGFR